MKQVPARLAEALINVCKKKSLENITVSQIAQEAGVTRQVFYHHFNDKYELALWIHHVHLYQSIKQAFELDKQQMWHMSTTCWLELLQAHKAFYANAFQSVSQREFQRIIREFYYTAYQWQMKQRMGRDLNEEEIFVLRTYLYGTMEVIYDWINTGMSKSIECMVRFMELAMPELMKQWMLQEDDLPYQEGLKQMEQKLKEEGLLLENSEEFVYKRLK